MSDLPSWAVPGTKLVCVDASSGPSTWGPGEEVFEGRIYTLKFAYVADDGEIDCQLVEVERSAESKACWGPSVGYHLFRFRPFVDDKSDNEIEARLYQKRLKSQVISPKRVLVE